MKELSIIVSTMEGNAIYSCSGDNSSSKKGQIICPVGNSGTPATHPEGMQQAPNNEDFMEYNNARMINRRPGRPGYP